jgi:hypothetical protein
MGNFEKRKFFCCLLGFKLQTVQPTPQVTITAIMYWLTVSASNKKKIETESKEI